MKQSGIELDQIRGRREEIFRLASTHGVKNVRVFGSVARGDAGPASDIDVLVDVEDNRSMFDLGGFQIDLQDLLGASVGVVTERSLHWYIRDRVLKEAVWI
jgi:uncharacterized protein